MMGWNNNKVWSLWRKERESVCLFVSFLRLINCYYVFYARVTGWMDGLKYVDA